MPKSLRHQRMAAKAARQPAPKREYEIIDPTHKPDLRGEFAGAKVARRGARQTVLLSERQAKFYLDQGAIRPVAAAVRADERARMPASRQLPPPQRRPATVQPMRRR